MALGSFIFAVKPILTCAVAAHNNSSSDKLLMEYERSESSAACCGRKSCCVLLGLALGIKQDKAFVKLIAHRFITAVDFYLYFF